jgi:hypothetical protein
MQLAHQDKALALAERVRDLFHDLSARGLREQNDLWFLHSTAPRDQQDPAAQKFARILADVRRLNPSNISDRLITSEILYGSIAIALWYPGEAENILTDALERIQRLASYTATRDVDIPIQNLDTGGTPFRIGPVQFLPISDTDKAESWLERIKAYVPHHADFHVVSYARVQGEGDSDTAWAMAVAAAEKALVLLRAIGFPFSAKPLPQIGILTDHPLSPGRPLRLGKPTESVRIEGYSDNVTLLGPPTSPYRLKEDLFNTINADTLEALLTFIDDNFLQTAPGLRSKFITGLLWLGRATFPDTPEASIAKLAFALESLIGGDPSDEYLASRGLTAALAERAAFIAGADLTSRTEVHRAVTDLYRLRSDIVHGRATHINEDDLPRYGQLVRSIAWALLRRLSTFTTLEQLQKWVHDSRYT